MVDRITLEEIRGCLAEDFPMWQLQTDRLSDMVRKALLAQSGETKDAAIAQSDRRPDGGLELELVLVPFQQDDADSEPYTLVVLGDEPLLRIPLSALLPQVTA